MGSGKSKVAVQLAASCEVANDEVVVISTSSIYLVKQLERTFRERLEGDGIMQAQRVGTYYTYGKDVTQPIIITCMNSLPELAMSLQRLGKRCGLWIPDECHRTETRTIKDAHDYLMPERICGFTATPFRSSDKERLTLFQKLLYDFGPQIALQEGVVVPWRIVSWTGETVTLDEACISMTALAEGPGMFNAVTIDDAELFAEILNRTGFRAEAIHSKLSETTVNSRIHALEKGELRAVVHVSMLQEGADFPWLRWLCLRRPVTSKVRFAQEVGRALRSWTDPITGSKKTEAIMYDPHSLFLNFQMSPSEVLGGEYEVAEPDKKKDPQEEMEQQLQQSVFDTMHHLLEVKAGKEPISVTPLAAYLTELVTAFDICGLIHRKIASQHWRCLPSTDKQRTTVSNMKWAAGRKCVPKIHQRALTMMTEHGGAMTRGVASNLLDVLFSLAETKKWPNMKHIDKAASDGIEKTAAKKIAKLSIPMKAALEPSAPPVAQGVLFEGVALGKKKKSVSRTPGAGRPKWLPPKTK